MLILLRLQSVLFSVHQTTTYVESAAGIGAGGRTGLTSVVTALMFLLSIVLSPFIGIVPAQATAPALIVVGIMMLSSFKEIEWTKLEVAVPAFFVEYLWRFAIIFMVLQLIYLLCIEVPYKESKGSASYFMVTSILFIINFIALAVVKS